MKTDPVAPPLVAMREAIEKFDSFLIASHVGPDGDAIGSALALRLALSEMGKRARVVSTDGVPQSCRFVPCWETVQTSLPASYRPDCAFILDCDGSPARVAAPYPPVENAQCRILIDHHRTAKPTFDVNWIDPAQPATAVMIYQLLRYLEVEISPEMAQCLMCGLSTDTGHFRFPNTTSETWRIAGELTELGAKPSEVAFKLFDERSHASTRLLGMALNKMQAENEGTLMWTALEARDFEALGTSDESSENVVNFLRNVRGARMALVVRERFDSTGSIARIGVRSEPQLRADQFCAQFGGGGHAAAAGCTLREKPFAENVKIIVSAAQEWLAQHPVPGR